MSFLDGIRPSASVKVGIVANEFFDPDLGRMGGFGWAARRAASTFMKYPEAHLSPVFVTAQLRTFQNKPHPSTSKGVPILLLHNRRPKNFLRLAREQIDVFLSIDYRTSYDPVFEAAPLKPIITWVRDPRPPEDVRKMHTLQIPGKPNVKPGGIHVDDSRSLAGKQWRFAFLQRRVLLANKMPHMVEKDEPTYGLPPSPHVLSNPSLLDYGEMNVRKSERPTVIFLGRLDPIKRPWLFFALARRFPEVEFMMMGQNHFDGSAGWKPTGVPSNLRMLGHLAGQEKFDVLSRAWLLVNTSIHEESPVSVLEALAYETPIVSYEDWGDLVGRHGIVIGQREGTGEEGLDDLESAVRRLLVNHEERRTLGAKGSSYVQETHSDENFLRQFEHLLLELNIR